MQGFAILIQGRFAGFFKQLDLPVCEGDGLFGGRDLGDETPDEIFSELFHSFAGEG